jgi:hypothetical protein
MYLTILQNIFFKIKKSYQLQCPSRCLLTLLHNLSFYLNFVPIYQFVSLTEKF